MKSTTVGVLALSVLVVVAIVALTTKKIPNPPDPVQCGTTSDCSPPIQTSGFLSCNIAVGDITAPKDTKVSWEFDSFGYRFNDKPVVFDDAGQNPYVDPASSTVTNWTASHVSGPAKLGYTINASRFGIDCKVANPLIVNVPQ